MTFNLRNSAIFKAVKWKRGLFFAFLRHLAAFLLLGASVCFGLFSCEVLQGGLSEKTLNKLLGGGVLGFCLALFFWELNIFFELSQKKPKLKFALKDFLAEPEGFNGAELLDYEAALVFSKAQSSAKKFPVLEDKILYYLLNLRSPLIKFVFFRAGLKESQALLFLKNNIQQEAVNSLGLEKMILQITAITNTRRKEKIGIGDILIFLSEYCKIFEKFLVANDLKKQDIESLVFWFERRERDQAERKRFWDLKNLLKKGTIAKDWASGYTITLDKFVSDLQDKLKKTGFRRIVGHQEEIQQTERILEKTEKNNVLLVGEPGVGRHSIIEALAQKAFFGQTVPALNYKRFLYFDITALVANITSWEETEAMLDKCFAEAVRAGNVVLVLDEFHGFVSNELQAGRINISGILSRYLPLTTFKLIAITSYEGLHRTIESNTFLLDQLEKVEVSEISPSETMVLLQDYYVPFFEAKLKKIISHKALREIIKLSSHFLPQLAFPDKAVKLLDESITHLAVYTKEKTLEPKEIKKIVTDKTQIPLEDLEAKEKELLLNLENRLHERLVNQEQAIKELANALRRARTEIKTKSGPIGAFLFLGPTGVGKTETAKALAALYFGSEKRIVRLDMSEFQNLQDIERLIGSAFNPGFLTTAVRENPFSLVLLDELEKAHPNILNLFLQVLDEGFLTDGVGRKVDFQNTIMIATSNAGAELIRQDIVQDKKMDIIKDDLLDKILREKIFRPEFINRFDGLLLFKPLTKENLIKICRLLLDKVVQNLQDKGIRLEFEPSVLEKITELSYNPVFGAREMKRVIQDKVENLLAEALLSGKIKRGERMKMTIDINGNFEIIKLEE